MSYQLDIRRRGGYLHAMVTGANTYENIRAYLARALAICIRERCRYVLIEEHLDGPQLKLTDLFDVAAEGSKEAFGHLSAVACVNTNPEHDHSQMQFAETVALNRFLNVRVFRELAEAEMWIETVSARAGNGRQQADAEAGTPPAPRSSSPTVSA